MHPLLRILKGTDRRSIGEVEKVVSKVGNDPQLFRVVFDGMLEDDPVLRMRCADAVEKITATHPELLVPHKKRLLEQVALVDQQEVRWHAAQLFSRLEWDSNGRHRIRDILRTYLEDKSRIVRTFTMQAMADLAEIDEELREPIVRELEKLTQTGSPAMQSRGRKLLAKLSNKKQSSKSGKT